MNSHNPTMSTLSALGKRWMQAAPNAGAHWNWRGHSSCIRRSRRFSGSAATASAEQVRAFLDPRLQSLSDPFLLTDLQRAAERIQRAIAAREKMVIFGDYDVDGITSSALLWRVLRKLGADVETFLPLRMEEGYGLSQDGVERCVELHQPAVLIAVDCGTTATPAGRVAARARHRRDHHRPPRAAARTARRARAGQSAARRR